MPLNTFHPAVSTWFRDRFAHPSEAQLLGWPAIAQGQDTLIAAPTGSGKTLAAFLTCIDSLVKRGLAGELPEGVDILYISPLKALGNDIEKNLEIPLRGIGEVATSMGLYLPPIQTAVRSGDTPAGQRSRMVRKPPHILITTPESLYILLTTVKGRKILATTRTVIVDEIHAVAGSKRGSHLALSLERLDALIAAEGRPRPVRVGLSATQKPIDRIARLLVGTHRPMPLLVDTGFAPRLDLGIEVPDEELSAVASKEMMGGVYDRIAALVKEHRSTLVFANTRRMVERVAFALEERLGAGQVAAHHGSLSRITRLQAEQKLKNSEVPCVVATASLELGIDVGDVDLVVQVGSPRSIAVFLQRVGRSGHFQGGTPKGRMFVVTRDQLVECASLVRAVRRKILDAVILPEAPLDILAQQMVAMTACEPWEEEALYALVTQASPYAHLTRERFDQVVEQLAVGTASSRGRSLAHVHRDQVGGILKGRRGSRIAAITSGGAIPDKADYAVLAEPDETRVGTLDEDFAIEAMAGDIFLLGNTSWRIKRVESGAVRVEDARGQPPTIPFWLGEAPARTAELSQQVGELREEVEQRLLRGDGLSSIAAWVGEETCLPSSGATFLVEYLDAGRRALGALPTHRTLVAERFFDEGGGMQLVIHSPLGGRINRAWGLALRKRFCRSFNFELQAAATDDGIVISLGPQHSFPLDTVFQFLASETVENILTQAVLASPMWATRWRWNATRSLSVLRWSRGSRVPPHLIRMRSDDLMTGVFPMAAACLENVVGDIEPPDHPLVMDTLHDCLTEALDAVGLKSLLERIEGGILRVLAADTTEPSPLCHEILNASPYAFLDDAPLEERRTRAVALRRGLKSDLSGGVGALDPDAIQRVAEEARPEVRDLDELHDLLLTATALAEKEVQPYQALADELVSVGRGVWASWEPGRRALVAAETGPRLQSALSRVVFSPPLPPLKGRIREEDPEEARATWVRGTLETAPPSTAEALGQRLGLPTEEVDAALYQLEAQGSVLRGRFSPFLGEGEVEWCDRRILARIHRLTLDRLRKEIEPVTSQGFMRFLLHWQHAAEGSRVAGPQGLLTVIEQLQGFEAAAVTWERDIFPARVKGYDPQWLDQLCLSGQVSWGRISPRAQGGSAPSRAAPISIVLREDLPWLLAARPDGGTEGLGHPAVDVLAWLERRGASFQGEIVSGTGRLACEVEEGLAELVGAGRVHADGFGALRALLSPSRKESSHPGRPSAFARARQRRSLLSTAATGRWSLLRPKEAEATDADALAFQLLQRYGVVFRDLLARETRLPPYRDLLYAFRRLEARGEIRGGRFVSGFVGEQFSLPEAVETLRALRRAKAPETPPLACLGAADPLNLLGVILPGPRLPAVADNALLLRNGAPLASRESGQVVIRGPLESGEWVGPDLKPRVSVTLPLFPAPASPPRTAEFR